ncbi:MAG: biotin/lipoyl attachment protein [Firmicutes bacterium]|nr:biotin/lipoyl attachment protein [Bacillota bacterium]
MATTYTITVNNKTYDVTVEKKDGSQPSKLVVSEPKASIVPPISVAAGPVSPPKAQVNSGGENKIVAPMPGKVIAVKVSVGAVVHKDQEIMLIEAMKMHNPILAPSEGSIADIYVKDGDPIQTGQVLVAIKA